MSRPRESEQQRRAAAIDAHVATRLLAARRTSGLSQEKAGNLLGISFQQMQKYEKGHNRLSLGRLAILAETYGVAVAWFFEGAPNITQSTNETPCGDLAGQLLATRDGRDLAEVFIKITDPSRRRKLTEFVRAFATSDTVDVQTPYAAE